MIISKPITIFFIILFMGSSQLSIFSPISNVSSLEINAVNDLGQILSVNFTNLEYEESFFGRNRIIKIGDGLISDVWGQVTGYQSPSYGTSGKIQSVYGENDIYFLLTYDASIKWVAIQWDSDFTGAEAIPMEKDDDIWVIGETEFTIINGDGYSAGQGTEPYIIPDSQNDLNFEVVVGEEFNQVELIRKLLTDDSEGRDVQFTDSLEIIMMMASSKHHNTENEISKYDFSLSSETLGNEPAGDPTSAPDIAEDVFITIYLNWGLLGGIAFLALVMLPMTIKNRRRS